MAPPLGVGALVGIVQPLLLAMIVEGKAGEEAGGHEQKQADKDRGANVTDAAVTALGAVAGALPWVQYQQLLGQHLRLVKRHAGARACLWEGPAGLPGVPRPAGALADVGERRAARAPPGMLVGHAQRGLACPYPQPSWYVSVPRPWLPPQTTTPPRPSFGPSA